MRYRLAQWLRKTADLLDPSGSRNETIRNAMAIFLNRDTDITFRWPHSLVE